MNGKLPYRKVAVIGAGPAGLTAAKSLAEAGLEPVVFEKGAEIGGNWRYDETLADGGGLAYRSLKTNTSRQMTAYSDFPIPAHLPDFLTRAEVLQYLNDYADHFHLHPCIRLKTTVESISSTGTQWQVRVRTHTGELNQVFDAVIVASGFYHHPFIPSFPGADTFQGQILHSADYKGSEGLEGKHVIVIGSGSSGADIASEVSEVAARVHISSRSGAYFIPHKVNGRPYDTQFNRLGRLIPPSVSKPIFHKMILNTYDHLGFTKEKLGLLRLPAFDVLRARFVPTVNLLEKILNETVLIKPDIARIEPEAVIYADQSRAPAEVLIYCTGYSLRFPFLDPTIVSVEGRNQFGLYKQVFHPKLDNLAFLAMNFVAGSALPLAEIQARWVARVFSCELELPSPTVREQTIAQHFEERKQLGINPMSLQLSEYMDEIASIMGVHPRPFKHPGLISKLWFGPLIAAQYRLDGPGKSIKAGEMIAGR